MTCYDPGCCGHLSRLADGRSMCVCHAASLLCFCFEVMEVGLHFVSLVSAKSVITAMATVKHVKIRVSLEAVIQFAVTPQFIMTCVMF